MTTSGLPFDDIRNLVRQMPALDEGAAARVRGYLQQQGAERMLGQVEDVAAWLAAATGRAPARVLKPLVALFAATHEVSRHLGADDPVEEARASVEAIAAGAAPVSHLCASADFGLNVFDLALDLPVGDITEAPALDERACAATMAFGMEAVAVGADLICLGAVGRAGNFSAKAVLSALKRSEGEEWTEEAGPEITALLGKALRAHKGHLAEPMEAIRRLGGRETAALAGAILAARTQKVAVILDGLSATAAAAVLHALNPAALDHCLLAGVDGEPHREAAKRMGLTPLLDLDVKCEGVAAALAAGLVKAAGELTAGMAEVRGRSG